MENHFTSRKRRHNQHRLTQPPNSPPSSPPPPERSIPISLGKPSLRLRLEAYYSLVAPDTISDTAEWKRRYELIYEKYGGSVVKERALAKKLRNKYGDTVRLRLTEPMEDGSQGRQPPGADGTIDPADGCDGPCQVRDESYYQLDPNTTQKGVIDVTSPHFDPLTALSVSSEDFYRTNPFSRNTPYLDNVSRFECRLPIDDPLRKEPPVRRKRPLGSQAEEKEKKLPIFSALAEGYADAGPLSLLHRIHVEKRRIRVMVRYVDCVRGTVTGYLLAFDKHMNMILRDVDEVYSGRVTTAFGRGLGTEWTKPELEYRRRICLQDQVRDCGRDRQRRNEREGEPILGLKKRHCQQLLLRGDCVVMAWRAEAERSAWPKSKSSASTTTTDTESRYSNDHIIGTPGSLHMVSIQNHNFPGRRKSRGMR